MGDSMIIGAIFAVLLSAIGISGMDRLIRQNVIATSGRAAEAVKKYITRLGDAMPKDVLSTVSRD